MFRVHPSAARIGQLKPMLMAFDGWVCLLLPGWATNDASDRGAAVFTHAGQLWGNCLGGWREGKETLHAKESAEKAGDDRLGVSGSLA